MAMLRPPPWVPEALELKKQGLSPRQISEKLRERGYRASHQYVWQWTTEAGWKLLLKQKKVNFSWE